MSQTTTPVQPPQRPNQAVPQQQPQVAPQQAQAVPQQAPQIAPVQGAQGQQLQRRRAWRDNSFRKLGWKSAAEQQTATHAEITTACMSIMTNAVSPLGAAKNKNLRDGAGKDFKTFQDLRTQFENRANRTPDLAASLKTSAEAYIAHFNTHSSRQQKDSKTAQKRDLCASTLEDLRSLDLAGQVNALPAPPWDSKQAAAAAEYKIKLDLASLPPDSQRAEYLVSDNVSPAFWISKAAPDGGKGAAKTFIFKPATDKPANGFPPNGEPAREALAGNLANMLNETLGMRLPVPNTQVVTLQSGDLPREDRDKLIADGRMRDEDQHVGSVQQFEKTDGSLADVCNLASRAKLDKRAVQELAVFDLITLNTDRHEDNFLVKKEPAGNRLIPIDHGNCFPEPAGVLDKAAKIGTDKNALMNIPATHEPFTTEMLVVIGNIDPDALANMLKRERDALSQKNQTVGNAFSDTAIETSKRSAIFLKRAAPQLTPAAIQVALSRHAGTLFDPSVQGPALDAAMDAAINDLAPDQDVIKEWFLMGRPMQDMVSLTMRQQQGLADVTSEPIEMVKMWKTGAAVVAWTAPQAADGALTTAEVSTFDDIKAAFPDTRPIPAKINASDITTIRNQIAAWAKWNQMGTPTANDKLVADFCKKFSKPTKGMGVRAALTVLQQALAYQASLALPANGELPEIKVSIATIDQMTLALSASDQVRIQQASAEYKLKIDPGQPALSAAEQTELLQAVRAMRVVVVDLARDNILVNLAKISKELDERMVGKNAPEDLAAEQNVRKQITVAKKSVFNSALRGAYKDLGTLDEMMKELP